MVRTSAAVKSTAAGSALCQEDRQRQGEGGWSIFEQLAREAAQMAYYTSQKTRSSRVIQTAVRLLLPGELAKHAVSEGTKAVRFTIHGKQTALFRATIFSRKSKFLKILRWIQPVWSN